jgi:hypothetical protein
MQSYIKYLRYLIKSQEPYERNVLECQLSSAVGLKTNMPRLSRVSRRALTHFILE